MLHYTTLCHTHFTVRVSKQTPIQRPLFHDNLDKPAPERQTILDFNEAQDDGVAVASARP